MKVELSKVELQEVCDCIRSMIYYGDSGKYCMDFGDGTEGDFKVERKETKKKLKIAERALAKLGM